MAIIEYFSHDYRARFDPKMRKLFMEKGVAGIGIYWCLIEMLYENDGKLNVDNFETIAFDLRIEIEILQEIVNNFDLFIVDNSILTNNGVKKRLLIREQKAEKNRKNGKKGGRPPQNSPKKTENKPTAIPTVSENNPTVSENNQNKKKDDEDDDNNARARDPQKIGILFNILKCDKEFWETVDLEVITEIGKLVCGCLSLKEIQNLTAAEFQKLMPKYFSCKSAKSPPAYFRACFEKLKGEKR